MPTHSGRILVIDDDFTNRTLLVTNLKEAGYHVEPAEDGQQALELLAAAPFDVVLLDLLMPGIDGFEVLTRMKADAGLRHIPVIVISALEEMKSVVRCIEMGRPITCRNLSIRFSCMPDSTPRWRQNACTIGSPSI